MSGVLRSVGSGTPRKERYYFCTPNKLNPKVDPNCPHPSVRIEKIEEFVLDAIRTHLLDKGVQGSIRDAIVRARSKNATQTSQDEKRLREIRRKIERGTENLALAGKQDFAAISKLLTKWREEEAEIVGRIERRRGELEPLPEALKIIRQLGFVKGRLQDADRVKLQYALRQTIASIRIGTRMATTGDVTCREHFGELRFHEALLPGKVIAIPDEAIGQRKIWREIGELCPAGRPAAAPEGLLPAHRHEGHVACRSPRASSGAGRADAEDRLGRRVGGDGVGWGRREKQRRTIQRP